MKIYLLSPSILWLFLFLLLLFSPAYRSVVALAQESGQLGAQREQDSLYVIYLPSVIDRVNNQGANGALITVTETLIEKTTADDAEIALEDIAMINSAALPTTIDLTEDYKAMGYPDSRKIVRGDDGDLYVAYRKKSNNQYRIFIAKSRDQGATWSVLNNNQPVETIGAYTQRVPALAVGKNLDGTANHLHLVWYGNDSAHVGNERQIKYLRLTTEGKLASDGCCASSFNIAGYSGQTLWQEHPTIYVNGSNVYIVWEGRDANVASSKIKFVRSTDYGQQWTQPLNIDPNFAGNFSRPSLAVTYVGEQRQLYTVAYGGVNGVSQIYWSRSLDNGNTWTSWQAVAAATVDQRHASMARDKAGKLHIVWRQATSDNSRTVIRYRVYDPALKKGAGGWAGSAQTIASRSGKCLFFPSIALGSNDRVWVVWTQSSGCSTMPNDDPIEGQIVYASKLLTGKWGNPVILTSGSTHLYASFRSTPTPTSDTMDLVWLDMSSCPITQPVPSQRQAEQEADVAAATGCTIRYTNLR